MPEAKLTIWERFRETSLGAKIMGMMLGALVGMTTFITAHEEMMPASRGYVRIADEQVLTTIRRENIDTKRSLLETQLGINKSALVQAKNQQFDRQVQAKMSSLDAQTQGILRDKLSELDDQISSLVRERSKLEQELDKLPVR